MHQARRRRGGSESEPSASSYESYDKHAGKLIQYTTETQSSYTGFPSPKSTQLSSDTMAQDRTKEFKKFVETEKAEKSTKRTTSDKLKSGSRRGTNYVGLENHAEFMRQAKVVGRNIAVTYGKLGELTELAKEKKLDDTSERKIQEYIGSIKSDLNSLKLQISQVHEVAKNQKQHHGKHLLTHSSGVALSLQSRFITMSSEYKKFLEDRTQNLKSRKMRTGFYEDERTTSVASQSSGLLENGAVAIDMQTQQMQQTMGPDQTNKYYESRADTMQNIESTIVELGGIFQQLAEMVQEQEEMVGRIDGSVESSQLSIEAAHSEIIRYFQSVNSNRWLMIKIFGVLIFFFIFFVVFLT